MKRFLFLILVLFLFVGCNLFSNNPDDPNTFLEVDYSSFVKSNSYVFPPKTDSVSIFNCMYSEYGYGDFNITGVYSHTETATLNGKEYSDTITKNIIEMKIFSKINNNPTTSDFCVEFITDNGENLRFLYRWQFKKNGYWNNDILDGTITILK